LRLKVWLALAAVAAAGCGSSGHSAHSVERNKGGDQATRTIEGKIQAADSAVQRDPRDVAALAELVRGHYQLATAEADPNTSEFRPEARPELQKAVDAWKRYEQAAGTKVDVSLGRLVIQAYTGLGSMSKDPRDAQPYWVGAADAAEIVATAKPNAQNYVVLVQYASLAGQTRKADLAGKQAIKLAPKSQKEVAKQAVAQAKQAAATQAQQAQGAQG
jgi:hypothetical protein